MLRARGDTPAARAALSELCEIYYTPVRHYMERWSAPGEADDLTQAFFARILENGALEKADPERGRFRNFLFHSAKHFLLETHARQSRQKRGGGADHLSLDESVLGDRETIAPDVAFDRAWACALLDRALHRLADEMKEKGKAETLEELRPWLAGSANHGEQAVVAERLGVSETAVRVILHRMRRRLRELVEAEIAQTLEPGEDVTTELRHLLGVW